MPTSPTLRLSVLDQSPVRPGATARQALQETTQLAQLADRLGYTRFWVSEHHNTITLAGPTPEVLLAHLGAHTSRIRLGSGGVMLPHYSALKGWRRCTPAASTWASAGRLGPTASRPTPSTPAISLRKRPL
jgi:hypothetical protein